MIEMKWMARIRDFYRDHSRSEMIDQSGELNSLKVWLDEISSRNAH